MFEERWNERWNERPRELNICPSGSGVEAARIDHDETGVKKQDSKGLSTLQDSPGDSNNFSSS